MANNNSQALARRSDRRERTVNLALDHAVAVMTERGVGGLTISEVARRMAVQPPSLYKYFDSLNAVYDRLFARGLAGFWSAVDGAAAADAGPTARLRAGVRAGVAWSVGNPALAQLLFWRVVPGFEPSPETFAGSVDQMAFTRSKLTAAVRAGELAPWVDVDEATRLLTVVMSGLISQQLANEPGTTYDRGSFSGLTDRALDMYLDHYRAPVRPKEN